MSAELEKRGRRRRRAQEETFEEEVVEEPRGLSTGKGRATPGRRNTQEAAETGNVVTRPVRGIGEYISGVRAELEKVTWPTREETLRLTRIVLIVTVISSIILGMISLAFTELFILGLQNPVIFLIFGIVVAAVVFLVMRFQRNQRTTTTFNSRL
jgi:preprotein translocase subunit SecE